MKRFVLLAFAVALLASISTAAAASLTDRIEWVDQFGTPGFDLAGDVVTDNDHAYVTGRVGGALPGETNSGGSDSYLRKYASDGSTVWTQQFGTNGFDGLTVVANQGGSSYVVGATSGTFPGETQSGIFDIFVSAFDADGNQAFVRQWGTAGFDRPIALTADSAGVYLLGMTDGAFPGEVNQGGFDLFLAKLDFTGEVAWLKQFGTPANDPAIFALGGVAVDDSGVYAASSVATALAGETALGNADAFLAKFGHDGTMLWAEQFGTGCSDLGTGLTLHQGLLVVVGTSVGDMDAQPTARCTRPPEAQRDHTQYAHAFVQARDLDGSVVWTRQFEGNGFNDGDGFSLPIDVAADDSGIYVASESLQTPSIDSVDHACPNRGPTEDIHTRAYDFDGNELWTQIVGTTSTDAPGGIAVNDEGVFVAGSTGCGLGGETSRGGVDAVVFKIEK